MAVAVKDNKDEKNIANSLRRESAARKCMEGWTRFFRKDDHSEDISSSEKTETKPEKLSKWEYAAMLIPPIYNVAGIACTWKQKYSTRKKVFLTVENMGGYGALGIGLGIAGFSPIEFAATVAAVFAIGVPIEWWEIKNERHKAEIGKIDGSRSKEVDVLNWNKSKLTFREYLVNQYQVFGYTAIAFEAVKMLLH
jgi:hypothetical protein